MVSYAKTTTGSAVILPDSEEVLKLVNSGLPEGEKVDSVEDGKYYGNREDGTLRVIYQPAMTHPWIHFSTRATAEIIEFFSTAFGLETPLTFNNQIWNIKEAFNFLGLIALVLLLVPMTKLLLKIPCFASLAASEEPPRLPTLTEKRKSLFWGGIVLLGAISFFAGMKASDISTKIFKPAPMAPRRVFLAAFDQNPVLVWTVINGIAAMLFFWLVYKLVNSKNGVTEEMIGWKVSAKNWFKTLGLAITIYALIYAVIALARWGFQTDFRIWTPAFKTYRREKLLPILGYTPFFFLYYLAHSLLVNGAMRVDGMKESKNLLICAIATVWGPILLWAIQYGTALVRADNTIMWGPSWMGLLTIFFCIPNLVIATYLSRYFFKNTGKVWLGAMVNTFLNVSMAMAATDLFGILV